MRLIYLFVLLLLSGSAAGAEELRIIDERGLLRMLVPVTGASKVLMSIEPGTMTDSENPVHITQIDGLAPDMFVLHSSSRMTIENVPPGTWQINGIRGKYIQKVELIQKSEQPESTVAIPAPEITTTEKEN